jgi:hypothetical protein
VVAAEEFLDSLSSSAKDCTFKLDILRNALTVSEIGFFLPSGRLLSAGLA